jgi:hypothetical protein
MKEVHGKNWTKYWKYIPLSIALGSGISINNSKAVFEAILGKNSEFIRTPKLAVTSKGDNWRTRKYSSSREITALIELGVGLMFMFQTFYAVFMGYMGWIPFLLLIQFGFIYTGILSIFHGSQRQTATINSLIPKPLLQKDKS